MIKNFLRKLKELLSPKPVVITPVKRAKKATAKKPTTKKASKK